jgi:hypothetical protein
MAALSAREQSDMALRRADAAIRRAESVRARAEEAVGEMLVAIERATILCGSAAKGVLISSPECPK